MCSNLVRKFIQTGTLNFNIACRSLMCTVSADGDGHGSIQWFDASFKWIKKAQPALIQIYPIAITLRQSYVIVYYKIGWLRVSFHDFFCFAVLLNLLFFRRFLFLFRFFGWHNLKIDYPMTKYALTLERALCAERIQWSAMTFDSQKEIIKICFLSNWYISIYQSRAISVLLIWFISYWKMN